MSQFKKQHCIILSCAITFLCCLVYIISNEIVDTLFDNDTYPMIFPANVTGSSRVRHIERITDNDNCREHLGDISYPSCDFWLDEDVHYCRIDIILPHIKKNLICPVVETKITFHAKIMYQYWDLSHTLQHGYQTKICHDRPCAEKFTHPVPKD